MGHLGHFKEQYQALVERLQVGQVGFPEPKDTEARAAWQEILEILYTPEDAAIAARMPVRPSGLRAIAAQVGIAADELHPRLEAMAHRGLVMDIVHPKSGKVSYMLSPPVVGFFEFSLMRRHDDIPKKRMAEALDGYIHRDPTFAEEAFGHETVIGRSLVQEDVIDDSVPEVLDWERATTLIETADPIGVSLCYCRHKAEHLGEQCNAPQENCLTVNQGAAYLLRNDFARKIEKKEALDILAEARSHGLVQIADNVQKRPIYICNCCGCCCGQLSAITDFQLPAVNPSGFLPVHDAELCSGCSRCARACPIQAITMRPVRVTGKLKNSLAPEVDAARCIGCGVCATACTKKKAMTMSRRPEQPYVPLNGMERVVRMSLERGHLADLLFDAGKSRGFRYLNSILKVLTQLPVAEQVTASEQVRSRFVRFTLGKAGGKPRR